MGTAFVAMSMSLDGVIGGSDVDTERLLHEWFFAPSERNEEIIDEILIHLVPVLLGDGIRLFETIDPAYIEPEPNRVVETPEVTHLRYSVVD